MNKYHLIVAVASVLQCFTCELSAQATIGTKEPPHHSALLELKTPDKNKGFLGSRVKLQSKKDKLTIADPANGLLVYNTADAGTIKEDSVKANRFYYWSEEADQWLDFMGQIEFQKTVNEIIYKTGVPQSVIYPLKVRDKVSIDGKDYFGIRDLLAGVMMGNAKNVQLNEGLNYTDGKVKLVYGPAEQPGKYCIIFEPGVYYIAFAYEVIPYAATPANCTNSSYYMDFPTPTPPAVRSHSNAYHRTGMNSRHGKSFIHVSVLDVKTIWPVDLGVGVAGDYLDYSNGIETSGFFFSDKGTYLYILRLGDV